MMKVKVSKWRSETAMAKKSELSKYMALAGRRGGKRRLETMTPEERSAIARKAGKASVRRAAKKAAAKARKR